jgi:hypothetical protein
LELELTLTHAAVAGRLPYHLFTFTYTAKTFSHFHSFPSSKIGDTPQDFSEVCGFFTSFFFFCCHFVATTYIDFASEEKRKALRRCPDMSRKRDGIVVSALSFLFPPLV